MARLILILSVLIWGCGFRRDMPQHLNGTVREQDEKGRLRKLEFHQWTTYQNQSELAFIHQEFDTLGRLIREWGSDHPEYGPQYLLEIFHNDNYNVENRFRWEEGDTIAFTPSGKAFEEEKIVIDSAGFMKSITIEKRKVTDTSLLAKYFETMPIAEGTKPVDRLSFVREFYFELTWDQIRFEENGRIDLTRTRRLRRQF